MTGEELLTTSPMLFGYTGRSGRLTAGDALSGARFRLTGHRAAQIITAFLEPRSVASAQQDGFSVEELDQARAAGILVSEREGASAGLWERHGWSRPAHLLFSQMDIPYSEFTDSDDDDRERLRSHRRATVEDYGRTAPYPQPEPLAAGRPFDLPEATAVPVGLSALTNRRSSRRFSSEPPRADQLAALLHGATHSFRTVAADRASGDPFRLLNSFFSWAHLFVVVQEVEAVPAGVYEYDWSGHRLVAAAAPPADDALLACAQGQRWVLGTGFAVFVVADLRGYAWLYRHSRAYVHLLIQLGELGQELLMVATQLGLAGWTSPAVHESRSASLLGLPADDAVEVLSIVKLGRPPAARAQPDDRRSGPAG